MGAFGSGSIIIEDKGDLNVETGGSFNYHRYYIDGNGHFVFVGSTYNLDSIDPENVYEFGQGPFYE